MTDKQKERAKLIADNLSDFVNGMNNEDMKHLINLMMNDHRTLLQLKFKLFLHLIGEYSEMRTDARNQYSHDTAHEIVEAMVSKRGYPWDVIANTPFI